MNATSFEYKNKPGRQPIQYLRWFGIIAVEHLQCMKKDSQIFSLSYLKRSEPIGNPQTKRCCRQAESSFFCYINLLVALVAGEIKIGKIVPAFRAVDTSSVCCENEG